MFLLGAAPAAAGLPAGGTPLVARLCAVGTPTGAAFPADRFASGAAACDRDHLRPNSPRIWAAAELSGLAPGAKRLALTFDPVVFDRMEVRAAYADGTVLTRKFGAGVAARRWLPVSRTWVPVPFHAGARLQSLAIGVDGPRSRDTFETLVLRKRADLADVKLERAVRFAALLMIMALPIFYNAVFFAVLRERFVLWHSLLLGSAVIYTASSSGMIYLALPNLALGTRWIISAMSFTIGVSGALMFARSFIEPGMMPRWQSRLLAAAPFMLLATTAAMLFGGPDGRAELQTLYYAAFAPVLLLCACVVFSALRRGSRAAKFIAVSWTAIIAAGIERVADGVGLYVAPSQSETYIYYAVCFETMVTALGVADRFLFLRRERDREHSARMQLTTLVETDLLTGLSNRRSLEQHWQARNFTALAIVDLDCFKQVNDEHGHDVGDRVLRAAAIGMTAAGDERLRAYRWGGEEFVLGISARSAGEAVQLAEAARKAVEARVRERVSELTMPLTASAGIVCGRGLDFAAAFQRADAALLQAKRAGRDRLQVAETPPEMPPRSAAPVPGAAARAAPQGTSAALALAAKRPKGR